MIQLPEEWAQFIANSPETGMGYTIVSIILSDGQRFDQVVIAGDQIVSIGGSADIPFEARDISDILLLTY
jgi:hypothetical protein